ncbi:MAG: hypothetical protein QOH48_1435 [Actinomycetota bacterium]|nr:hypothetical protein [Actinomycetota bacterium]
MRLRAAGGVLLILAALTCTDRLFYAAQIRSHDARRGRIFLFGMGSSWIGLTQAFVWRRSKGGPGAKRAS